MKKLSVIFPVYNEEENISFLYERLRAVSERLPDYDFNFIFIDDCSSDQTPSILEELGRADGRVQTIRFSRNCGSHAALAAGLAHCDSEAAIMLSCDLQDPPEIIPDLIREWERGYRVVWGVRAKRQGESLVTRISSRLYYILMNLMTDVRQYVTGADVFLIDRHVINAFNAAPEKNTSVFMLIAWLGFSQSSIEYVKESRHAGSSKWTLSRKLRLFFDSLISFSYAPLRLMSLMGSITAFLGLGYGIMVLINGLKGSPVMGWSSLMIVILVLGGLQLIMLGILGEYLWRTYDETRRRPRYVIEKNTVSPGMTFPGGNEKNA